MTGLELLLTALVAGAAAGVGKTATQAISDSYAALKTLLVGKLKGRPAAIAAVEAATTDKEELRRSLAADLSAVGADTDEAIQAAAADLLSKQHQPGGQYTFIGGEFTASQFGSGNTQTVNVGKQPKGVDGSEPR